MSLRKKLKRASLALMKSAGLLNAILESGWRRERLAILGYHGVSIHDEHEWDPRLYLSPAAFEQRMEILKRSGCRVLPLAEAVERMIRRDLPPKSVALTFDDGSYDFYARAFPIVRDCGFPVTVFLTTYYCDYNRPVFDVMVSYLLWKGRGSTLDAQRLGLDRPFDLRTAAGRDDARNALFALAAERKLGAAGKDRLLEQLAELAGVDYNDLLAKRLLRILGPPEVGELASQGVDFQLHTHRHRTPLDRELFAREIRDNRDRIGALAGTNAANFCYPCGSHKPEFVSWLKAASVRLAVTCEAGLAGAASDPLLLPRVVDHGNLSPLEFESCLAGLAYFLPGAANRAGIPLDHLDRLHSAGAEH